MSLNEFLAKKFDIILVLKKIHAHLLFFKLKYEALTIILRLQIFFILTFF